MAARWLNKIKGLVGYPNRIFFGKGPVSIFKMLLSTVLFTLIIAFIELLVAYFIIFFLNGFSISSDRP